jgi:hypothetical protein
MMDAMYDMPSLQIHEIEIDLDYAKEKFERANQNRLKAA